MKINSKLTATLLLGLFLGVLIGSYWQVSHMASHHHSAMLAHLEDTQSAKTSQRAAFVAMKNQLIDQQISEQQYQCCLEKPCTYCLEKTPGHGEGASCHCLSDIMNGVHPCGECIGEILEGHGNRFIAKYFATAIAEEVGETHLATLKLIMADKYGVSVTDQL
ncbi:MAG: hypothetical protein GF390_01075 [Candidatus Pacebacteria bacterium]|nr:hypothetical protein [Candidatus Paceibacterota bacterium]